MKIHDVIIRVLVIIQRKLVREHKRLCSYQQLRSANIKKMLLQ